MGDYKRFAIGDNVIYPAQGLSKVIGIESKDLGGRIEMFYILNVIDKDRKILVPVKNAELVGMRGVVSEEEISDLFDIMAELQQPNNQTWKRRYRVFMDKIKTNNIYEQAEVLRDLYHLKADKELSFSERCMLDNVRISISTEIAMARDQSVEDVVKEIESVCNS